MVGFSTMFFVKAALMIASMAYQQAQAKKAAKKAAEARQAAAQQSAARKGLEIVTDGEISDLIICYGRNEIGGNRVYHNIKDGYQYTTPNSDLQLTSKTNPLNSTRNYNRWWEEVGDDVDIEYSNKNEFLFFQQAMCVGPIHAVHDIMIDDVKYLGHGWTEIVQEKM